MRRFDSMTVRSLELWDEQLAEEASQVEDYTGIPYIPPAPCSESARRDGADDFTKSRCRHYDKCASVPSACRAFFLYATEGNHGQDTNHDKDTGKKLWQTADRIPAKKWYNRTFPLKVVE